ncbi:hypothetical protein STEG23_030539 [Scotinomys teguina]
MARKAGQGKEEEESRARQQGKRDTSQPWREEDVGVTEGDNPTGALSLWMQDKSQDAVDFFGNNIDAKDTLSTDCRTQFGENDVHIPKSRDMWIIFGYLVRIICSGNGATAVEKESSSATVGSSTGVVKGKAKCAKGKKSSEVTVLSGLLCEGAAHNWGGLSTSIKAKQASSQAGTIGWKSREEDAGKRKAESEVTSQTQRKQDVKIPDVALTIMVESMAAGRHGTGAENLHPIHKLESDNEIGPGKSF